jgi:hypothetical protein
MNRVFNFIGDIKFNFINFFAFWIFNVCACVWFIITLHFEAIKGNEHVAEVRTLTGNICVLIVGFFFGASKSGSKKDEVIHSMSETAKNISETK